MKNRLVVVVLIGLLGGVVVALGYHSWRSFAAAGRDIYVLSPARQLTSKPSPNGGLFASISHVHRRRVGQPVEDNLLAFRIKSVATGRELVLEAIMEGKLVQEMSANSSIRWEGNATVHFVYPSALVRSFAVRLPSREF